MHDGRMLGPHEIREKIGAGGTGGVYRAEDTRLGLCRVAGFLLGLAAAGCVSTSSTRVEAPETPPVSAVADCPAPLEPYVKVTLYMGRGTQDASEWQGFVDDVLASYFPDGGTMLETSGWWEGRVGDAADKNSRMLVMLHPAADRETFAAGVQAVIADIKARFGHRAVLWEEAAICATLSS